MPQGRDTIAGRVFLRARARARALFESRGYYKRIPSLPPIRFPPLSTHSVRPIDTTARVLIHVQPESRKFYNWPGD